MCLKVNRNSNAESFRISWGWTGLAPKNLAQLPASLPQGGPSLLMETFVKPKNAKHKGVIAGGQGRGGESTP